MNKFFTIFAGGFYAGFLVAVGAATAGSPHPLWWGGLVAVVVAAALALWGWAADCGVGLADPVEEQADPAAPRARWGERGFAAPRLLAGVVALIARAALVGAIGDYLPLWGRWLAGGVSLLLGFGAMSLEAAREGRLPPWLWPGRDDPFNHPPRPPERREPPGTLGPAMDGDDD